MRQGNGLGYKPGSAFWCSLESTEDGFYSAWDELYGDVTEPNEDGKLYASTVEINPTTYVFNPTEDEVLLDEISEEFQKRLDII